jgi:hypothetical protein
MKKLLILLLICLMGTSSLYSDDFEEIEEIPREKRFGIAFAEVMASNIVAWSYSRYLREDNYSFLISWKTVEFNLRHGFEWDPNNFGTNFLNHPYQGSTYYNAARTNGFNFWESIPFTFGGSMMWEIFMESEFPSYNDIITTTWGGVALGETLFRFSEQVLDDRSRGGERFLREFGGFLINPVGGFNRLIMGEMFQHTSSVNHMRLPIQGYLALGGSGRVSGGGLEEKGNGGAFEVTMHYGRPFQAKENRKPFDYFTFRFWTSRADTTRNLTILSRAFLAGKNLEGKNDQKHLWGLFQHFDYIDLDVFKIGGIAFAGGILSRFPLGKGFELVTGPALGIMPLAAGDNEYVTSYQGRNYNYGWGYKGRLDLLLRHNKFGEFFADYNYWFISTREGAPGVDRLHLLNATYKISVWRNFGLGFEYSYYLRNANYDNDPDVRREISGIRGLITYSF